MELKMLGEVTDLHYRYGLPRKIQILRGMLQAIYMYRYLAQTWRKMWKNNADELRAKTVIWRTEPTVKRIEKPSRLDRARRLGYKAKQGIIVIRTRVKRGGMRKQRPRSGRRPKHLGVVHIKQSENMRRVAERRVNEKYPNMEVLGSYYLHKDGKNIWYEIILADTAHPAISKDREMRGKLKAFAK